MVLLFSLKDDTGNVTNQSPKVTETTQTEPNLNAKQSVVENWESQQPRQEYRLGSQQTSPLVVIDFICLKLVVQNEEVICKSNLKFKQEAIQWPW